MKKLTKEEIKHIAHLAKLSLSDTEVEKYQKEFEMILNYISKIDECDISGLEFEHNLSKYNSKVFQPDIQRDSSLTRYEILSNATDGRSKNGYIKTSKIVTKE